MNKQVMATVLGGALAAAALAGCSVNEHTEHGNGAPGQSQHSGHSQDPGQPQSPGQDHSGHGMPAPSADVSFAQAMVPHHQQALEMSRLAQQRAADPRVRELATRIEAAQGPEIDSLTGWLRAHGAPAPAGHQHMDGMMSPQQMGELAAASGPDFDHRFLQQMIAHHEGAVRMAETELTSGSDPQLRRMAENVSGTQREEIDTMRALMGS